MRPLKLTMTAFGPYAKEQVIDFSELSGRNLFLITGATGSGKTTIFDAICYAIYGKASGKDRDGESLRSHFAADGLLTYVELEFELRGKRYWIRRVPKQIRQKTIGDGTTEQNAQAQLKILDEDEARLIDGVRNVDEKVLQILGITYDQFKQIIMIPQGEFRELLTSDSSTREAILQKIFGTESFRLIQEKLGDEARELRNQVLMLEKQRENSIENIDCTTHEDLAGILAAKPYNIVSVINEVEIALNKDKEGIEIFANQIKSLEDLSTAKQQEIYVATANNQKLKERDQAEQTKASLEAQKPYYEQRKEALTKARKALTISGIEDNYRHQADLFKLREAELLKVQEREKKVKSQVELADKNLEQEKLKEPEREELKGKLTILQGLTNKVADLQGYRQKLSILAIELEKVQTDRIKVENDQEETKQRLSLNQSALEKSIEASRKHVSVCKEKENVEKLLEKNSELRNEQQRLTTISQEYENLQSIVTKDKLCFEKKEKVYEEAKSKYFDSLAGVLAENLQNGQACPVCGSEDHPTLALKEEGSLDEKQLEVIENELKTARKKYEATRERWETIKSQFDFQQQTVLRIQKELAKMKIEDPQYKEDKVIGIETIILELREMSTKLAEQLKDLNQLIDKEPILKKQINKDNLQLTESEQNIKQIYEQEKNLFSEVKTLEGMIKNIEEDIPPNIRTQEELEKETKKVQSHYDRLKLALQQATESLNTSREALASVVSDKQNASRNSAQAQKEMEKSWVTFADSRIKAGFTDEEQYLEAKMPEEMIAKAEKEISDFQETLRSATDYFNKLVMDVQGKALVNVSSLERELEQLGLRRKELSDVRTNVVSRKDHNEKLLTGILSIGEDIREKEQRYEIIGDLASTARGQNSQRISFERYVLAAFFNDIIDAANLRLNKMTCGRYEMSRIIEKGKGSAQSGLELEVFDFYTGRARHVKTLSGGESFKASLALALGLADVVQSYAGGVSLDTMFVDEGFGTLDPESLDNAIDCLIELQQSGRLVGIISHVPELKTTIDARLEVEANKDGSRAVFYVS